MQMPEVHLASMSSEKREEMTNELIMVINDDQLTRKLFEILLTMGGYKTCSAPSAEEALVMLQTVHPCLILMDIRLTGMDGLVLTKRLKADPSTRDIFIVAITVFTELWNEDQAKEAGCDDYIPLPFETD